MKRFIRLVLKRFGYSIVKVSTLDLQISLSSSYSKVNLLKNFFEVLQFINFKVNHIIDVGANHGTWTREALKYFPESCYTLLEPQFWMKDSIADLLNYNRKITFLPVGAGNNEGIFNFTITDRDDSCSFRYTKHEAEQTGMKQIKTNVLTLNSLVKTSNYPFPEIVKIDAEGLDLSVLEGATNLLGKVEVFMVEAGIVNKIFDNSLLKLVNYMDDNGYNLFDITDLNRPFNHKVLWLVELVFVKKGGVIDTYNWQ